MIPILTRSPKMLKMTLLRLLCSMVPGGLQNLVFVVLEVCAEALQKMKSYEENWIVIWSINVFVDHGPTWISRSDLDEVVFLCDSLLFLLFVPRLCVCLQILHEAFEKKKHFPYKAISRKQISSRGLL